STARHRRDTGVETNTLGQRHLVQATVGRLGRRDRPAARDVYDVAAVRGERAGYLDGVLQRQAAIVPVAGGDADRERTIGRPGHAYRVEELERKREPVREGAAVLVGALVGQGRQEVTQQMTVPHL